MGPARGYVYVYGGTCGGTKAGGTGVNGRLRHSPSWLRLHGMAHASGNAAAVAQDPHCGTERKGNSGFMYIYIYIVIFIFLYINVFYINIYIYIFIKYMCDPIYFIVFKYIFVYLCIIIIDPCAPPGGRTWVALNTNTEQNPWLCPNASGQALTGETGF